MSTSSDKRVGARVTGKPYVGDDAIRSELPHGSVVVERYVYTSARGSGVQWLAQTVDKDGFLRLVKVCKTRHEALVVLDGR